MPVVLIGDLKKVAEFLVDNQGSYDLSKLNKLLNKKAQNK